MTRNMSNADRWIRFAIGLVLIILPLFAGVAAGTAWLWWGMLVVGAVLVATAAFGSCPAYTALGTGTRRGN